MAKKKTNDHGTGIPLHEVEALARILFPQIQAFFESEEGKKNLPSGKQIKRTKQNKNEGSLGAISNEPFVIVLIMDFEQCNEIRYFITYERQ